MILNIQNKIQQVIFKNIFQLLNKHIICVFNNLFKIIKNVYLREDKMIEEQDMKFIYPHKHIKNTPTYGAIFMKN